LAERSGPPKGDPRPGRELRSVPDPDPDPLTPYPAPDGVGSGSPPPAGPDLARSALDRARSAARAKGAGQARWRRLNAPTGTWSGAGPDRSDPQPFGALIGRLVDERGWATRAAQASVLARWEHLVGAGIAAHSEPESLRDGVLIVAAESTAWATQLRLLAPRILAKLGSELGAGIVTTIRVHGPAAPSWKKGPRSVRGRGPRDTYG